MQFKHIVYTCYAITLREKFAWLNCNYKLLVIEHSKVGGFDVWSLESRWNFYSGRAMSSLWLLLSLMNHDYSSPLKMCINFLLSCCFFFLPFFTFYLLHPRTWLIPNKQIRLMYPHSKIASSSNRKKGFDFSILYASWSANYTKITLFSLIKTQINVKWGMPWSMQAVWNGRNW